VLSHTPHIHEWEIKSGADIYAWMEQRHDAADHVLSVTSPQAIMQRPGILPGPIHRSRPAC
jgi:hypothetical protein